MREFKFYYPDGTKETNKEKFIKFYNQVYYYLNKDRILEKRIEEILNNDTLDAKDIIDILRWKIDAVDFDYQTGIVRDQWKTINVNKLSEKLIGQKKLMGSFSDTLESLIGFKNIGPVYAITILYFLTNGECPIYDKFAHIALKVIYDSCEYQKIIRNKDLNEEFHTDSAKGQKIYDDYKKYYVDRLDKIFGNEYKTNRDIDRALWAYGHLFSETRSNEKK